MKLEAFEPPVPVKGLLAGSWGTAKKLLYKFFFFGLEYVNDQQVVFCFLFFFFQSVRRCTLSELFI